MIFAFLSSNLILGKNSLNYETIKRMKTRKWINWNYFLSSLRCRTHIVELVTLKCYKLIWIELLAYMLSEWYISAIVLPHHIALVLIPRTFRALLIISLWMGITKKIFRVPSHVWENCLGLGVFWAKFNKKN
jgi:hypothetical protein